MTGSSPPSWLVRARRAGGGTLGRQGAPAVVGLHTLGRGRSYLRAETPQSMPWLWPGCAHLGGRMGAGQGSAPWSWPVGARRGGRLGAGQGSTPRSWPVGARWGGRLGAAQAARPGRGLLAHAGAGGWALDRAARPGRGLFTPAQFLPRPLHSFCPGWHWVAGVRVAVGRG